MSDCALRLIQMPSGFTAGLLPGAPCELPQSSLPALAEGATTLTGFTCARIAALKAAVQRKVPF